MRFKLDFVLRNNWWCFRRYLIFYSKEVQEYLNRDKDRIYSIDKYIAYLKVAKLDGFFYDSLTEEEVEALEEWTHTKDTSYNLPPLVERAFEKWQRVFFPEQYEAYYDELDPVMLGLVLEAIREYSGITRSDAAYLLQVNRKTVHLIENGQRLPSLDYIYKFARLFQISIDSILGYL
jgi:DNA-binding XRE family transcriptional regulator